VEVKKLLRDWLHTASGPKHVIITCRVADYSDQLYLGLPKVVAEEMDVPRIRQFAANYLGDAAEPFLARVLPRKESDRESERHLFRLARNPPRLLGGAIEPVAGCIFVDLDNPSGRTQRIAFGQRADRSLENRLVGIQIPVGRAVANTHTLATSAALWLFLSVTAAIFN
jgi:hypothetical protein